MGCFAEAVSFSLFVPSLSFPISLFLLALLVLEYIWCFCFLDR